MNPALQAVFDEAYAHDLRAHLWNRDDEDMAVAAFRYCLGRRTHIVGTCVDWLLGRWPLLAGHTRKRIRDETTRAIADDKAGANMDVQEWQRLLDRTGPSGEATP